MKILVYTLSCLFLLLASTAAPALTTSSEPATVPGASAANSGATPEGTAEEAPGADVGC